MLVTINPFRAFQEDHNGTKGPIIKDVAGSEDITANGNSAAMPAGVIGVEIATDTAITVNAYGAGSNVYIPANGTRWFPAVPTQVFAIAEVV